MLLKKELEDAEKKREKNKVLKELNLLEKIIQEKQNIKMKENIVQQEKKFNRFEWLD